MGVGLLHVSFPSQISCLGRIRTLAVDSNLDFVNCNKFILRRDVTFSFRSSQTLTSSQEKSDYCTRCWEWPDVSNPNKNPILVLTFFLEISKKIFYWFCRYAYLEDHAPELVVGSTEKRPLLETPGEVCCDISRLFVDIMVFAVLWVLGLVL